MFEHPRCMFTAVSHPSLLHIDFLDLGERQGKIGITADFRFINHFDDNMHFHHVGKRLDGSCCSAKEGNYKRGLGK